MLADDGLLIPEVGIWAEDKHRHVELYDRLFSTGMKNKWDLRIYLDLYAGPGYARIRGRDRIIWGSPLRAMAVPDPFDKYIFCESEHTSLEALRERVQRHFQWLDTSFVEGDCNEQIDRICSQIPTASKSKSILSFCFLDPFDISIKFSTVRRLSGFLVDFMILLALHQDANRNQAAYLSPKNTKVEEFLGLSEWRALWANAESAGISFPRFLAETYSRQMESLGYLPLPFHRMKQIRSDERNLPLYRLALFSRHELAYKYWTEVLRYSTDQTDFGF